MPLLVTSASGQNGKGFGKLLAFDERGKLIGPFSDDLAITDPRGLGVEPTEGLLFLNSGSDRILALDHTGAVVRRSELITGLDPGGGNFGPNGRYYVGLRRDRTIAAFPTDLQLASTIILPKGIVPFPRGFAFGKDDRLYLASGVGPGGLGDNSILAFEANGYQRLAWRVEDLALSPLDLTIAPNGNILVSSEMPFGHPHAVTTIREYDANDAHLVRVLSPNEQVEFRQPRGLRFGPAGVLYCAARDEVVAFDFETGECLGAAVVLPNLHGQALTFFGEQ